MMRVVESTHPEFAALWHGFTRAQPCTWRYAHGFLRYQRAYAGDMLVADLSFLLEDGGRAVALCPLLLERRGAGLALGWGRGDYLPAPIAAADLPQSAKKEALDACFARVDQLAGEHGAGCARMLLAPGSSPCNLLTQYGFLDTSATCAVLDLAQDPKERHARLRKSYKPLINKALRLFEVVVSDHTCPDPELTERYREMHHKAAGRVTRPLETFRLQHEMIERDEAMLIGLKQGDAFAAFSFFLHCGQSAYYGSAADDPDFESPTPLEHAIIWRAAEYYQARGLRQYEIGLQPFGPQLFENPSDKDLSIAFFKRGFGGDLLPLFRGVQYYDPETLRSDLEAGARHLALRLESRERAAAPAGDEHGQ